MKGMAARVPKEEEIREWADKNAERIMDALDADDQEGFCVLCGEDTSPVEPDARAYECTGCGNLSVYGASELMLHVSM